ncbi:U-box domain-containing protein 13 [Nymphaea thermarum]|nr:U-box domain-containing protein 13 [Nymphaea thermarum]
MADQEDGGQDPPQIPADPEAAGPQIPQAVEDPGTSLCGLLSEISGSGDFRFPVKKESANLSRRLTLLSPFFEELKEAGPTVMEAKQVADEFHEVTSQLVHALGCLPFDQLEISDEVREQVELVHAQLRRAKDRSYSFPDEELLLDLQTTLSDSEDNVEMLKRVAQKLQLTNVNEIEQEFQALQVAVTENSNSDETGDYNVEQMVNILERLKKFVVSDDHPKDEACGAKSEPVDEKKPESLVIPDDFRCPISLELMRDPVIVATGQTYERSCIQRWIDSGHKTCPKTQQTLPHLVLTPNYVLRSLISHWCETNGIEQPKKSGSSKSKKSGGLAQEVPADRVAIDALVWKLSNGTPEEQRFATGELRMLSKRNTDNRVCIAEAGAIPILVKLLSTNDKKTQEHAVTAILNLSIYDNNKGAIVMAGAIPDVVEVLKSGSMESRENAAATLFSLSLVDENKITIGASGAISALVELLQEGRPRGKKDAATALFNLCIYQGNKARAVRAGILAPLMELLVDPSSGMVDEALAILAVLASHHEGKIAIGKANAIPLLVDLIRSGLPRNKENAAAILLSLCKKDVEHLFTVQRLGAFVPLTELVKNGTERAKRKAASLLEHLSKLDELQSSKQ